ncbi:MAG: hypothetical protein ABEJ58_07070 [Halodesulfurarchaeum sp.]
MKSTLIGEEAAEQLVRTCRTASGDNLRSITYFTPTEYDQLYLRQDLDRDADISTFIGAEMHSFKLVQDAYRESELGEHEFTIRSFENGYLLRVASENEGIFVTTDSITLQEFDSIATALTKTLETWRE